MAGVMRAVLVGMNNPLSTRPEHALFPAPERKEVALTGRIYLSVMGGSSMYPAFVGGRAETRQLIADVGVWKDA